MKKILSILLITVLLLGTTPAPARAADVCETAVAYMDISFECGCTRLGTGTMIAVNGLVTAAHNLVCYQHSRKLKTCTFYFGRNNDRYHYKYDGSFSYTWFTDFSNGYESGDDIGYVVFPKDIGKTTGWYGWSVESDDDIRWEFCHIAGYNGAVISEDFAQVDVLNAKEITWPISYGLKQCGQGGPVYYLWAEMDYPVLVAVYTTCGTVGYARRMTTAVYESMKTNGVKFN